MSFGASAAVRFENHSEGNHRPVIFWEEQAKVAGSSKKPLKLSYRNKQQPYPLRSQQHGAVEEPAANVSKNKLPSNRKAPVDQVTKQSANSKMTNGISGQLPKATVSKKTEERRYGAKKKKVPETAGTVVLTQKEFDAILDTIGQLAIEADRNAINGVGKEFKKPKHNSNLADPGVSVELTPADGVYNNEPTPRESLAVAKELPPSPALVISGQTSQTESKLVPPTPGRGSQPKVQQSQNPPGTTTTPANQRGVVQAAGVNTSMNKPFDEVLKGVQGVPLSHLTKAERKRLQWEQERAEQLKVSEWNPWGRPGGGAPIKDTTGNILADYKTRAHMMSVSQAPASVTQAAPPAVTAVFPSSQVMTTAAPTATVTTASQPPPAAIRSSLVIGEAEPDENRFESAKEKQRKQWLAELEQQREEQRQRKLNEKNSRLEGEMYDTWADHFTTYKAAGLPSQPQVLPEQHKEVNQSDAVQRVNSAPVAAPVQPTADIKTELPGDNYTHLRGQNVFIDPQTLKELDEKRRKQLEYQEYIRHQIEEKERQKREEKERRMREEQEEEEKLRKEHEKIERRLQQEKDQLKVKEEQEVKRLETLRQAMEEAQLRAEQEKHAKRLNKLHLAGHDTSQLMTNLDIKVTPRIDGNHSNFSPREKQVEELPKTQSVSQNLEQSYGSVRVLTPSKFRQAPESEPVSPRKEFGVQTDIQVGLLEPNGASRESTSIEYQGPIQEKKKKVRVQSAPKQQRVTKKHLQSAPDENLKRGEVKKNKQPQKLNQRPSWGYQNPKNKRPVKQSEKDPFYEEKIQKRVMMKVQRQNAMHRMAEKYSPKASKVTTVSSRARSRSHDRDESEERKTILRSRSRSPAQEDHLQVQHRSRKDSGGQWSDAPLAPAMRSSSRSSSQGAVGRSVSPPVPAIRHRLNVDNTTDHPAQARDMTSRTMSRSDYNSHRSKYQDQELIQAPVKNSDFVPFIRSSNVLDPAHAESPVPLSREASVVERARRAYVQELNPAKFGFHMDNYKDDGLRRIVAPQSPGRNKKGANPILNPELVKEHPTTRQTQILQHLSDLRRGLLQKQRELELEAVYVE